jgi:hypothetical protein
MDQDTIDLLNRMIREGWLSIEGGQPPVELADMVEPGWVVRWFRGSKVDDYSTGRAATLAAALRMVAVD